MNHDLDQLLANAILGIDTLWGGDVMEPSGTGRFIADSWFSDLPLPVAYSDPTAARLRAAGGVTAAEPDTEALDAYLAAVDVRAAIAGVKERAAALSGLRGAYIGNLATSFEVMWDLAMEVVGRGDPVPWERCVRASTAAPPEPSQPAAKRNLVAELLTGRGYPASNDEEVGQAVDAWRQDRLMQPDQLSSLCAELIGELDQLTAKNVMPHVPDYLADVPRSNIEFLPIKDAWFSGSMNYIGRARRADGSPEYEASYEINASLVISVPELKTLISHEVVPGHVTTFAFLQKMYVAGDVGFEGTVLTMNTLGATLAEGIANNAILMAYGITEVSDLPDSDLKIATLLGLLQDDAKNQASYLTWHDDLPQAEVAAVLRRDYLVSSERADKLSGPWARHPLLGRMYLPAYRTGTDLVARLRREYPPNEVLPAIFGCRGLVDGDTVTKVLGRE